MSRAAICPVYGLTADTDEDEPEEELLFTHDLDDGKGQTAYLGFGKIRRGSHNPAIYHGFRMKLLTFEDERTREDVEVDTYGYEALIESTHNRQMDGPRVPYRRQRRPHEHRIQR